MKFYSFALAIVRFFSYVFYPVKVHGDVRKLPDAGGVILCANHISFLDVIFLGIAFKRQIRFVGKEKYASMPVLRTIFKWCGGFGIDPEKPDIASIKKCIEVPKNGEVLGIFPEGTRILHGKVSTPMPGVSMIASRSKAPIFYARIKPKHGTFRLFSRTDVFVGELVTLEDLAVPGAKGNGYKESSEKLMKLIYGLGE